jgi:predicted RecB family endonuclease
MRDYCFVRHDGSAVLVADMLTVELCDVLRDGVVIEHTDVPATVFTVLDRVRLELFIREKGL